jgi:hypothetical protein
LPNKLPPKIFLKSAPPLFSVQRQVTIGFLVLILCFFGKPITAHTAEDFDPIKYKELELLQADLLEESALKKPESVEQEDATQKDKEPDKAPSQKGYYRVQDREVEESAEKSREELEIMLKPPKKTLRDRLGFYLDSSFNYDSNVFNARKARGDFYYTVTPGITIDATKLYKQLGFDMGIGCTWRQYFSFARLNSWSPNINLEIPGIGQKFRMGKKLTLRISTGISFAPAGIGDTQDTSYFTDSVRPYLGIHLNYLHTQKFSVGFSYNASAYSTGRKVQTVTGTETLDTGNKKSLIVINQSMAIRPRYHITPKTSVFLGYAMGMTRANSSKDAYFSDYMRLTAGIDGKITAKSVASLEAGWERRSYKAGRSASNSLYLQAAYIVQLTKKWSASVTAIHDMNPSIDSNTNLYYTSGLNMGINFKPAPKWVYSLSPSLRWNHTEANSNIESNLNGGSSNNGNQDNFTVGFATSIRYYAKRWLSLGLVYSFDKRWADKLDDSYVKHVGTVDVNIHI